MNSVFFNHQRDLGWNTNALNTNGVLSVVAVAKLFIGSAVAASNSFIFAGTGGMANASYYLLGATNLDATVSTWTRQLTNQFENTGNFNFTNAFTTNMPQQFCGFQL